MEGERQHVLENERVPCRPVPSPESSTETGSIISLPYILAILPKT